MNNPEILSVASETWPLKDVFTISRGAKTEAHVVTVTVARADRRGRGEAVPYARYGESVEQVCDVLRLTNGCATRLELMERVQPGAARNALDCALWDLEAKESGVPAWRNAGLAQLKPVPTAYTISLAEPRIMAAKARAVPHLRLLKLKLGGPGDEQRMAAVRQARPEARLIADANEAWTLELFPSLMQAAVDAGLECIEQPLPEGADEALKELSRPVPVCADESIHVASNLRRLIPLYDAVNIKLDKAGGLTGAIELQKAARAAGLKIMAGSMVGTSLAVAPAMIIAQDAEWADLDGPLLLARDRDHAIAIENGVMAPPSPALWG